MNKQLVIIGIVLALLIISILLISKKPSNSINQPMAPPDSTVKESPKPSPIPDKKLSLPKMEIDKNKNYTAILNTSKGIIKISLNASQTPVTVNNFVYLSKNNFYNKTIFHRIIKDFMIQGGDPKGDGTGGPGYRLDDEPFEGEYERGVIAMANAGPNTNGSQFFIIHKDYDLPKKYVIFGKVIEGIEVVDEIASAPVKTGSMGENSQPVAPVTIETIEVIEE